MFTALMIKEKKSVELPAKTRTPIEAYEYTIQREVAIEQNVTSWPRTLERFRNSIQHKNRTNGLGKPEEKQTPFGRGRGRGNTN